MYRYIWRKNNRNKTSPLNAKDIETIAKEVWTKITTSVYSKLTRNYKK